MPTLQELRQQPHWSVSSLNALLNGCRLQWAYSHVYQFAPAFTPLNLAFGQTFHRACEQVLLRRRQGQALTQAEALDCFAELWRATVRLSVPRIRFEAGEDAESCLVQGQQMLAAWLARQNTDERVVAISSAFSVPLVDSRGRRLSRPLIGEFDAVLERDGLWVIVDWKTAANRWPEAKAGRELQPTAYLYASRLLNGGRNVAFRYEVVTKAKKPACELHWTTRDSDDFDRLVALAAVAEGLVEHGLYAPAEQSFFCGSCPYQQACKTWHQRGTRQPALAA